MNVSWWHWIILGFGIMVAQLIIPSFTLFWFGLGAIFTGLVAAFWPSCPLWGQVLAWVVSSLAFDAMWFKYVKPTADRVKAGLAKEAVVGGVGIVVKAARTKEKGVVKFEAPLAGADEWSFFADEPLLFGDRVKVVDVSGKMVKVVKI